jgi:hypothetical protein
MMEHRIGSLTAAIGVLAALAACSRQSCLNEATIGLPSPDGARIAYVFHRTCGGAPMTTHVSVISLPNSLRNETGNVLTVAGDQPVKIAWRSPTNLHVTGFVEPEYELDHPLGPVTVEFH